MKWTRGFLTRAGSSLFAGLALTLGACNNTQTIRPPEESEAESPKGYTSAEYALEVKGAPIARVQVWSLGTDLVEASGRSSSLVLVGFRVENTGEDVVSFSGERLLFDAGTATGYSVNNVRALDTPGSIDIAPAETREIQARFELPGRPPPRDVQAFRVHWTVLANGEFNVLTPFLRPEARRLSPDDNGFYYSPNYDPFYEGAFDYRSIETREQPFRHEHFQQKSAAD